jgi:hypothetical protein
VLKSIFDETRMINRRSKPFTLKPFDFICFCRQGNKVYNRLRDEIRTKLSVENLFKNILEFEKMKELLLNPEQRLIIDGKFFYKDVIKDNEGNGSIAVSGSSLDVRQNSIMHFNNRRERAGNIDSEV